MCKRSRKANASNVDEFIKLLDDCIRRGQSMANEVFIPESNFVAWSTEVRQYITRKFGADSKEEGEFSSIGQYTISTSLTLDRAPADDDRRATLNRKITWLIGIKASQQNEKAFQASDAITPLAVPDKVTLPWLFKHVPALLWVKVVGVLLTLLFAFFVAGVKVGTMPDVVRHLTEVGCLKK